MEEEARKKIEELMAGMQCPKNFKCEELGFERLCKARDFGLESYLDCIEENPRDCPFALPFGYGHLCKCPLRVYLAKKLKKYSSDKDAEQVTALDSEIAAALRHLLGASATVSMKRIYHYYTDAPD